MKHMVLVTLSLVMRARVRWLTIVIAMAFTHAAAAVPLTIMTQNMDEGTDYTALLTATSPGAFVAAVTQTYQTIEATQPAARASAIANEIAARQPDIVALQEASIVRTSTSGPATTVTSDLLGSLLTSLNALGLHYAPVIVGTELDAQAPSTLGFNVRLTTQDVILARTDLPAAQLSISNAQANHYATQLVVPTPVGAIPVTRGWLSADVTVDGQPFRFVTTHLDTGQVSPAIPFAQAQELLATAGNTTLPIIYAGDFNSSADDPLDATHPTYQSLLNGGLADAWTLAHPGDPGFTCCEDANLLNATPDLTERIDLALFKGPFTVDSDDLAGVSSSDKTSDGMWPSDHAGMVVTFDVPEPAPVGLFALGFAAVGALRGRRWGRQSYSWSSRSFANTGARA